MFFSDLSVLFEDGVGKLEITAPTISGLECSEIISETLKVFFDKNVKNDSDASYERITDKFGNKIKIIMGENREEHK